MENNSREELLEATADLLRKLVEANGMDVNEIACVFFTTTADLDAAFPALAARQLGWTQTALLCGHEMNVPGSLTMCLRVLILYNTEKPASEMVHVYLKGAQNLRPDGFRSDLG